MSQPNYDPFLDYEKYGDPFNLSHADREKRMDRIMKDMEAAKPNKGKFVYGENEVIIEMPKRT